MPQPSFLTASLCVAGGGAFGSWLRYLAGQGISAAFGPVRAQSFPYSTLTVNVLGSLLMGAVVGWLARYSGQTEALRLLLAVGLLGGFTTFSSFSLDVITLVERGAIGMATLYIGVSLVAGIASLFLGLIMMRSLA